MIGASQCGGPAVALDWRRNILPAALGVNCLPRQLGKLLWRTGCHLYGTKNTGLRGAVGMEHPQDAMNLTHDLG